MDLGLSDKEARRVMGEADFNEDGEISYEEFIPLAVELVGSMYAKMEAEYARQQDEDEAREEAQNYLLHGMTKQQVRDRTCKYRALRRAPVPRACSGTGRSPISPSEQLPAREWLRWRM